MKDIELSSKQKKKIKNILYDTKELEEILEDLEIEDQEDFDGVVELIQEYKEKKTFLEKEKNSINKPLNEIRNKVSSWFNPPIKALDSCIQILREKIVEYEQTQKEKQIEAIKKRKKVPIKIKSDKVTYRNQWTFRVTDFNKIPIDYLTLDKSKVKIELRELQGDLYIPGIEVYQEKIPVVG